jgi:hypothetical protein
MCGEIKIGLRGQDKDPVKTKLDEIAGICETGCEIAT